MLFLMKSNLVYRCFIIHKIKLMTYSQLLTCATSYRCGGCKKKKKLLWKWLWFRHIFSREDEFGLNLNKVQSFVWQRSLLLSLYFWDRIFAGQMSKDRHHPRLVAYFKIVLSVSVKNLYLRTNGIFINLWLINIQ